MESSNERIEKIAEEMSELARLRYGPERLLELQVVITQAARSIALIRDSAIDVLIEPDFLHPVVSK